MTSARGAHFRQLLDRLRQGDEAAVDELVGDYGNQMARSIRRSRRRQRLRREYDTEQCVQSVWASIFADLSRLVRLESPKHLACYLRKVARNKLVDRHREMNGKGQTQHQVLSLNHEQSSAAFDVADNQPSPSYQVALKEDIQQRSQGLSEIELAVVSLVSQGLTMPEIQTILEPRLKDEGKSVRQIFKVALRHMRKTPQ